MILCRLNWFLEYRNVLHISQSSFRQCRKTTDHLLRLHDAIHKSMANKRNVLSVFIDIENAYEMVNKVVLLSKLLSYGISGRMFRFIRSFLSNRSLSTHWVYFIHDQRDRKRHSARKRPWPYSGHISALKFCAFLLRNFE